MTDKFANKGRWVSVDANVRELAEESWSTYWSEMTAAESIDFLQDPKAELLREGIIGNDYRVQTHIVNSDIRAVSDPVCKLLLVFPDEKLAILTVYKHPPTG